MDVGDSRSKSWTTFAGDSIEQLPRQNVGKVGSCSSGIDRGNWKGDLGMDLFTSEDFFKKNDTVRMVNGYHK